MTGVVLPLLFAAAAAAPASHHTPSPPSLIDRLPVMAGTQHFEVSDPRLDHAIQVFVHRPATDGGADEKLPVIYVLDSDQNFPILAGYRWYLTFEERMPPSILVGIGYGTIEGSANRRSTDYTAPAAAAGFWGGARRFLDVLRDRVFPRAEAMAGGDAERRTLVGQSLGGQFVLYAMLESPSSFDLGVAVNPSFSLNLDYYLGRLDRLAKSPKHDPRSRLYIATASEDIERFRTATRSWVGALDKLPEKPWCVKVDALEGHTHLSSMPEAFRRAMKWRHSGGGECGLIDSAALP